MLRLNRPAQYDITKCFIAYNVSLSPPYILLSPKAAKNCGLNLNKTILSTSLMTKLATVGERLSPMGVHGRLRSISATSERVKLEVTNSNIFARAIFEERLS